MRLSSDTAVLVVGGTGQQGGAVAWRLTAVSDCDVAVLTRSPGSDAARALASQGVQIVTGDLLDRSSLDQAVTGVDAAFFTTDYHGSGDPETEREQGANVVAAAEAAGLDHLVYSSSVDVMLASDVPHFDAKAAVERACLDAAVPATVLRPAPFFQTLDAFAAAHRLGLLAFPVPTDASLPIVDVREVASATRRVLASPDEHNGDVHRLVAGQYTLEEVAEAIEAMVGQTLRPVSVPLVLVRRLADPAIGAMFAWFGRYGLFRGPVPARLDLAYTDLETYLNGVGPLGRSATRRQGSG